MKVFFLVGLKFHYTRSFNFNNNSATQAVSGSNSNTSLIQTQSSLNDEILFWPVWAPDKYICIISFSWK